jgi:ParB-like chromosome segregation protein Spo0J
MDRKTRLQARSTSPGHCSNHNSNLKILYRRIDTLQPDPSNPRRHSKKQIGQIAESIKVFGFNVPLLIDGNDQTIAGHGRLLAACTIGMTEVPTVCLDHLTPTPPRAYMIADNKLTENATWDDRLLAQQFKELSLLGLDFSLEITGFEMAEIDLRIASLEGLTVRTRTRPMSCPRRRWDRRLAKWAISGFSAVIGSYAAAPSIRGPSRR